MFPPDASGGPTRWASSHPCLPLPATIGARGPPGKLAELSPASGWSRPGAKDPAGRRPLGVEAAPRARRLPVSPLPRPPPTQRRKSSREQVAGAAAGSPGLGSLRVGLPRWGPRSPRRDAVTGRPVPPWASLVAPFRAWMPAWRAGGYPCGPLACAGSGRGSQAGAGSIPQPPTARWRRPLPARWRPPAVVPGSARGAGEASPHLRPMPFRNGLVRIRGCPLLRAAPRTCRQGSGSLGLRPCGRALFLRWEPGATCSPAPRCPWPVLRPPRRAEEQGRPAAHLGGLCSDRV